MASGEIIQRGCLHICLLWLPEESPTPPQVSLLPSPWFPSQLLHPCSSLSSSRKREDAGLGFRACWAPEAGNRGEASPWQTPSPPPLTRSKTPGHRSPSARTIHTARTLASVTGVTIPSHGVAAWLGKVSRGCGTQLSDPASQDEPPWGWWEGG